MDDFTAEVLAAGHHHSPASQSPGPKHGLEAEAEAGPPPAAMAGREKSGGLQDRLVERLLQQIIPADDDFLLDPASAADAGPAAASPPFPSSSSSQRPNFSLATMSYNFRHFNARIGVVFDFQEAVIRLLSWHRPSQTLSFLAVYTLICLDPYLLSVLPVAFLLFGLLIPSFIRRHPAPPRGTLSTEQRLAYTPRGPPLMPAPTVRPAKDLSKDFFRNMRDLQNSMGDFSHAHDKISVLLLPVTNFSNEALSSAVFLFLVAGGIVLTIAAHLLPWRYIFLLGGWAHVMMGHPGMAAILSDTLREHVRPRQEEARCWLNKWIADDVILDAAPEAREVEIFELQRASDSSEWEPWLFSPSPYDPLSQPRLAGQRPRGSRFFEDVLPPEGWTWSEKKWALDLWSRDWVEERIITGVEVETEGERWVYDIHDERAERMGVVASPEKEKTKPMPLVSWEEGQDGSGRQRGEWRRRRWVRLVKRRVVPSPD